MANKKYTYHFDPKEHYFLHKKEAIIDPLEEVNGNKKYIVPAYSTLLAPPKYSKNKIPVFDATNNKWKVVVDHRGRIVYDPDGNPSNYKKIGPLPKGWTVKRRPLTKEEIISNLILEIKNKRKEKLYGGLFFKGYIYPTKASDMFMLRTAIDWYVDHRYDKSLSGRVRRIYCKSDNILEFSGKSSTILEVGDCIELRYRKEQVTVKITEVLIENKKVKYEPLLDYLTPDRSSYGRFVIYKEALLDWQIKLPDGRIDHIKVDETTLKTLYSVVTKFTQDCFTHQKELVSKLFTLTKKELDEFDVNLGWPKSE